MAKQRTYQDGWTKPLRMANGQWVYGGAARNVRIVSRNSLSFILLKTWNRVMKIISKIISKIV